MMPVPATEDAALLKTILDVAQRLCPADAHAVWWRDRPEGSWRSVADQGLSAGYPRTLPQTSGTLPPDVLYYPDVLIDPRLAGRVAAYEAEGIRSVLAVPLCIQGEHTATITCYYREPGGEDTAADCAVALAELASRALTAATLNTEQRVLRTAAEDAERRASFLAEASKVLASSLDYETTLRHVAQLAVPDLADWCTVHLVESGGPPRQVAVAHVDPAKLEWARAVRDKLPYDPDASTGMPRVLRTGQSEFYPFMSEELLHERVKDPERLAIIRQVGITSLVIVPLTARGQVLGALTLISAESGIRYDERVVELAEDLGRRAGTAIDNARLLHEAREAEKSVRYMMEHAHCLLWQAEVQAPEGAGKPYRWDLHLFDPAAAQRFLPLELEPGESFAEAFYRHKPEEDRRRCDRNARAAFEAGAAGYSQEFRCVDRHGTVHWLHEETHLEPGGPGKWRAVGVCTDITERRRLQVQAERLAAIVTSSDDAIVSKNLDGIVQSWNQSAERMFGYSAEEMVGQSITVLFPPDRMDEEPAILERLRRGERVDHFETIRLRKDGKPLDISVTISPVLGPDGQIIGASKVARDITLQKTLQRELQERVEALAEADRRKDEFLAMLAHELRNPLMPLATSAGIIKRIAGDNPMLLRQQELIERKVRQMARMLDDLLDVSRITRGKVSLEREEVDLSELVAHAVDSCRSASEERQHTLALYLPRRPVPVFGDPLRLEQILSNLILNAVKYTNTGGEIDVRLDVDGAAAEVVVRDNGIGISPVLLPAVFELFTQGERGLDRAHGGLGIGLTLVRTLVELHGGTVEARSEGVGLGSEFRVRLPLMSTVAVVSKDGGTPWTSTDAGRQIH